MSRPTGLRWHQRKILRKILQGKDCNDIAADLGTSTISAQTSIRLIGHHLLPKDRKHGPGHVRAALILVALKEGWLTVGPGDVLHVEFPEDLL